MAWSALSGPRCIWPLRKSQRTQPFKDKRLACADRHGGICSGRLGKSFYETYWMMRFLKQAPSTERSKWTPSPRLSKPPKWSCARQNRNGEPTIYIYNLNLWSMNFYDANKPYQQWADLHRQHFLLLCNGFIFDGNQVSRAKLWWGWILHGFTTIHVCFTTNTSTLLPVVMSSLLMPVVLWLHAFVMCPIKYSKHVPTVIYRFGLMQSICHIQVRPCSVERAIDGHCSLLPVCNDTMCFIWC